ncbi:MAG: hypothetical protein E7269_06085 [Lachnospiraceae bacterium]|nr:hypothetical protein [Lachnospiraceae bacterium]
MSGVFLSKQYAMPYYIAEIDKNIYSIEELSYYLYHYLPIVERDFFCDELVDYIEQVLGMKMIGNRMREYIHQRGTLADLVLLTVKSTDYFDEIEILALQKRLDERKKMSPAGLALDKAEAFVKLGKYGQAVETYKVCLTKGQEEKAGEDFFSQIHCRLGSVYGKMLRFEEAEDAYRQSMIIKANKEAQMKMVLLLLIQGREAELPVYIKAFNLSEPQVRECERQYGRARQTYLQTKPREMKDLAEMKANYRRENGYH